MKKYLPKNNKTYPVKTRNPEEYQIDSDDTERLKNSPIVYRQGLLNES